MLFHYIIEHYSKTIVLPEYNLVVNYIHGNNVHIAWTKTEKGLVNKTITTEALKQYTPHHMVLLDTTIFKTSLFHNYLKEQPKAVAL